MYLLVCYIYPIKRWAISEVVIVSKLTTKPTHGYTTLYYYKVTRSPNHIPLLVLKVLTNGNYIYYYYHKDHQHLQSININSNVVAFTLTFLNLLLVFWCLHEIRAVCYQTFTAWEKDNKRQQWFSLKDLESEHTVQMVPGSPHNTAQKTPCQCRRAEKHSHSHQLIYTSLTQLQLQNGN